MSLTGNLSTMSLAEIFQWLNSGVKTGTLLVESKEGTTKEIYFQSGFIKSASSNDPRELIGQFLLNCNKISEQQLIEALEKQKSDHVLLGTVLVGQGILGADELNEMLRTISEEIIYDLFLWREGKFEFKDGDLPKRELASMNLDITHIVLEGARRDDEWGRIKDVFRDETVILRPNIEKITPKLPLKAHAAGVLACVDGTRSLYEVTRVSKSNKFEMCRNLLDLYEEGMIQVGDFEEQIIQPPNKTNNNSLKEMLFYAECLIQQGRIDEAETAIRKLEEGYASHPDVKKVRAAVEDKKLETTAKRVIKLTAVPKLNMDITKITQLNLSPEEGFIVSRINGVWDVKSIIKISPFDDSLCLKIFKQFLDSGVINFR